MRSVSFCFAKAFFLAWAAWSALTLKASQRCPQLLQNGDGPLFRTYFLPLDVLIVVRSSTCGAKTVDVVFDVVVAKLADLDMKVISTELGLLRIDAMYE